MNKNDLAENDINSCPKVSVKAKIISKIEAENYKDTYFGYPHIVFETANMERIKFAIKDKNLYENLIVGDQGLLEYAGKAFISFSRESINTNNSKIISTFNTGDSL